MIEIIYKEEKTEANGNEEFFYLPKNIRQIGESKGTRRIYAEDYVYTFLKRMPAVGDTTGHAGILLGRYKWKEGLSYLFIQSAMEISDMEVSSEHIRFSEKIWGEIHDKIEQYFKGQEILGWFLRIPGSPFEISDVILHTHLNHFAGNDKVLFLMNPTEKEEAFFAYENGQLQREQGFYIYYEKNEPMQSYLVDFNENRSIEEKEEQSDHAVAGFRKAVEEKQEENIQHGAKKGAIYALATCAAAAVVGIGFAYVQDSGIWHDFQNRNSQTVSTVSDQTTAIKSRSGGTAQEDTSQTAGEAVSAVSDDATEGNREQDPVASPTPTPDPSVSTTPEITGSPSLTPSQTPDMTRESMSTEGAGSRSYLVQRGDTLSKISMEMYGSLDEIDAICELNNLESSELIYAGQKLLLP
ncbi:MAG: LysM peptidoglycan-binding domain-containing protein [Lachnospiraceae bacterium]|nr:LysM peptidoglycan-binding domain-containing protein [Lachnospiraceae bacterium]